MRHPNFFHIYKSSCCTVLCRAKLTFTGELKLEAITVLFLTAGPSNVTTEANIGQEFNKDDAS